MKGDFTRLTFDKTRHFSRVLMQQGRVQLDADWNEQAAILLHYLQALAADLIGPFGGPDQACGFILTAKDNDFVIGPGHYYVDGILCENDRNDLTYFNQTDYPLPPNSKLPAKTHLVYLDVWERHITSLEDGHIRDVALGGADTATRAKVVWQVRAIEKLPDGKDIPGGISRDDVLKRWPDWVAAWKAGSTGQLKARLRPEQASSDPCTIQPSSAYRGQENQLYRVEIHSGGTLKTDQPTFKWSRDNGSIAATWLSSAGDGALIPSRAYGFEADQWVEIANETDDLAGLAGRLHKIVKVEGGALYLETPEPWDKSVRKNLRRWDQKETEGIKLQSGAVPIGEGSTEAAWIDLENGLQVQFQPGGVYRTGDYWLIPARTATGQIEWLTARTPDGQEQKDASGNPIPRALAPDGIEHHYAPLALIGVKDNKVTVQFDLLRTFAPIKP